MDELNQHECMAALTGLIGHMHRTHITPETDQVAAHVGPERGHVIDRGADEVRSSRQETAPAELPPWMKYLHGKLSNPTTPLNVRLFVSKMVVNTEEVRFMTTPT